MDERRKSTRFLQDSDVVSHLPEDVIDRILQCLPIRDAARTSILSRKWRDSWIRISQLVFDKTFWEEIKVGRNDKVAEFLSIINKILLLHSGPVSKFGIVFPSRFPIRSSDIDPWILYLSRNSVRELVFVIPEAAYSYYRLPYALFTCLTLTHLKLANCVLNIPPTFKGFPNLVSFELVGIRFQKRFDFSSFPLLETLTIKNCKFVPFQHITAPKLKSISVDEGCDPIVLSNNPNLMSVSIMMLQVPLPMKLLSLTRFLEDLSKVEKLSLNRDTIKYYATGSVPKRLPTLLKQLKFLELPFISFDDLNVISWVLCLIRSCPNLEKLQISSVRYGNVLTTEHTTDFFNEQEKLAFVLSKLTTIEMTSLLGLRAEIELMKILLASSPVLEEVTVFVDSSVDLMSELYISKQLMRLRRASPKAEILWRVPNS